MIDIRSGPLVAACAISLLIAGCGSSGSDRRLGSTDAAVLHQQLAAVRVAASGHDRGRAVLALDRFSALVHKRAVAGDFSPAQSQAFRKLIRDARARIGVDVTVPAPVVTPTVAPAPSVTPVVPAAKPQPPGKIGKLDKHRRHPVGPGKHRDKKGHE